MEKDRVTGETKVLSSTTMLPQNHCLQGVKVYEDELKGRVRPSPHRSQASAGAKGRGRGRSHLRAPEGTGARKGWDSPCQPRQLCAGDGSGQQLSSTNPAPQPARRGTCRGSTVWMVLLGQPWLIHHDPALLESREEDLPLPRLRSLSRRWGTQPWQQIRLAERSVATVHRGGTATGTSPCLWVLLLATSRNLLQRAW